MSDQTQDTGKQVTGAAESAVAQVKEQAEAVLASIAASEKLASAKKQARKVQTQAAKRGQEFSDEAASRGRAAARQASHEAKKRGSAALASAPVVAAGARKKGEQAFEVARERSGEALLSALATDAGKRLAATGAGTALKSKLTARKRRRRKLLLLIIANAGGAAAFRQLRAKRAASAEAGDATPFATPTPRKIAETPPTDTVAPGAVGTAAGLPVVGVVEESIEDTPSVADQTEAPAVTATEDGELHTEAEPS